MHPSPGQAGDQPWRFELAGVGDHDLGLAHECAADRPTLALADAIGSALQARLAWMLSVSLRRRPSGLALLVDSRTPLLDDSSTPPVQI